MMKWHWKLGHVGWKLLKEVGRRGILGKVGEAFKEYDKIVCHSCQGGKQGRTSTEGQTVTRQKEGILSAEKLEPGDLVFSDQYESSIPERFYNVREQMNTHHTYSGGTVFYDT